MNTTKIINHCNSELFNEFHSKLNSTYIVTMLFTEAQVLQSSISVNGKTLIWRESKNSKVLRSEDVLHTTGTPLSSGGSIRYPSPSFREGFVIVKFRCIGFPINVSWSLIPPQLLSLELLVGEYNA